MNTETVELEVPDESLEALRLSLEYAFEADDECVQRIAAPVVIAELRKIRDMVRADPSLSSYDIAIYALTRANELKAGQ